MNAAWHLCFALVLTTACAAPPKSPAKAPTAAELKEQLRCALHSFVERCPTEVFVRSAQEPAFGFADIDVFVDERVARFDAAEFDDESLAACLAALDDCADVVSGGACDGFLGDNDGRLAGTACTGFCAPGTACIDGTCVLQRNVAIGGACDDYINNLNARDYCINQQAGLTFCDDDDDDGRSAGVCRATPAPGEACERGFVDGNILGIGYCRGGRACDLDSNICTDGTVDTAGVCTFATECALDDRCIIVGDTLGDGDDICVPATPIGAPCSRFLECDSDAWCTLDGVCEPLDSACPSG